ncbi:MAG: ADOP family duplicated permease [Acidobacteriota bacterium]
MVRKLWNTLRGRRLYKDIDDELQFHLDHRVEELVAAGETPEEARRQVRLRFGNKLHVEERMASADMLGWLEDSLRDFRYGLRNLRRNFGFAVVAVATLAVGIGAATAVFSIVNGVLFEALPYQDPSELALIFEHLPGLPMKFGVSPPDFEVLRREARSFTGMAAYRNVEYELSGIGQSRRLTGARVSPELFPVLGVMPAIGRVITSEDDRQNASVVVLSHRLWSTFGRDPSIVGRTVLLDRRPHIVVGIMPEQFEFPPRGAALNGTPAALFVPMSFSQEELGGFGMNYNKTVVARLKLGVSVGQARAEMDSMKAALVEQYPEVLKSLPTGMSIPVVPLNEETAGRSRNMLLVLLGGVAIVLLIVCADVANLMLTRFGSRQREIAVRSSLGASSARIVRQLVTESLVLGMLGSAFGLLFAWFALRALLWFGAETLPRVESIAFNGRVLGFAVMLALLTPLLFGVLPAFRSASGTEGGTLKDSPRTATAGRRSSRLLGTLAATQIALALVLSVGAGLLLRSFLHLVNTDPGFRTEKSVLVQVELPLGAYADARQMLSFCDRVVQAAGTIPGVLAFGVGSDLPLGVRERRVFTPERTARPITERTVAVSWASPGYLEALGIPLKRGRGFTEADRPERPAVIINHMLAEMLWPGEDPIGRRIKWGIEASTAPWMTIVGVVGDVKQSTLDEPTIVQVYAPLSLIEPWSRTFNIVVRSERDSASLIADLRRVVQYIDPLLPISKAQPLEEVIGDSVRPRRFSMTVVTVFAAVALALAAIGIYGVLASLVSQQTRDIAIRMALGASASGVIWMVFRRALVLMAAGISFGVAGALGMTRLMAGLLYGVRPTDAMAFFGAAVVLALLALLAGVAPAWRATHVDPVAALKTE